MGLALLAIVAAVVSYLFLDQPAIRWLLAHHCHWHRQPWADGFRQLGKAYIVLWLMLLWSCLTNRWRPTLVRGDCVDPGFSERLSHQGRDSQEPAVGDSRCCRRIRRGGTEQTHGQSVISIRRRGRGFCGGGRTGRGVRQSDGRLCSSLRPAGIGVLRVTSLTHYPSDVFAGAAIGALAALQAMRTASVSVRRISDWMALRRRPGPESRYWRPFCSWSLRFSMRNPCGLSPESTASPWPG